VNHIRWQGRCREMFLRDHAPSVLEQIASGLCLVTTRCSCEYLQEVSAFDQIIVRMRLGALAQNRMTLHFEYCRARSDGDAEALVARGEQQIAFMRREGESMAATAIPDELLTALRHFA
jgi:enediyne biosynthesis thioesterase